MNDLVAELKARLKIEEVVLSAGVVLRGIGRDRVGLCPFHDESTGSFNVHPEQGYFKCFGCGKAGDVLTFLALHKFRAAKLEGTDFVELLKYACTVAGIPYPEKAEADSPRSRAAAERRAREEILERYLQVAEAGRDAEFFVRARQRKAYLVEDVCVRWRLGNAPALKACLDAGLSELELRRAGLLRDPQREGPDEKPYMFFRESIVIPCVENGRVVYLTSRYLSDVDGRGIERDKKSLHLPVADFSRVAGDSIPYGLPKPCGFNLEARYHSAAKLVGILIVEGPLDAIACTELEHPAIGMLGSTPAQLLADKLPTDCARFFAPDGTKDVTQHERCSRGAVLGYYTSVCVLPTGKDPDDLPVADLEAVKSDARPVLTEYLTLAEMQAGPARKVVLDALGTRLAGWAAALPALAGDMRAECCSALGLTEDEYGRWIAAFAPRTPAALSSGSRGQPKAAAPDYPDRVRTNDAVDAPIVGSGMNQPTPLAPAPVGLDGREKFRNFEWLAMDHPDYVPTLKRNPLTKEEELVPCSRALTIDVIIKSLFTITGGWPCHVLAPGARAPLLFADNGNFQKESSSNAVENKVPAALPAESSDLVEGVEVGAGKEPIEQTDCEFGRILAKRDGIKRIKWIPTSSRFKSWIHERTRLEWKDKTDVRGANFVEIESLCQSIGALDDERHEYSAVEIRPHWPPLQGHYYAWTQPVQKIPSNGEYLRTLIDFFDNVRDKAGKAVLLAAILTPGWGGPYGKRPAFVTTAPDRGYGKTTVAEMVTKIWGGHISINYAQKNDDELYQRLLSAEALTKRCCLIDNVKGTLSSGTLDQLITGEIISGKRMYSGEASRPNTMTYIITANGVRLSRDMATRSYFIVLDKPQYRPHWDEDLAEFVYGNMAGIIGDCIMLLKQKPKSECKRLDRWGKWIKDVLCRACDFLGDITPNEVMEATYQHREECDDDLEEARMVVAGVLEKVCDTKGWITFSRDLNRMMAYRSGRGMPEFIKASEMVEYFKAILGKPKLSAKQVNHIIQDHLEAGRMKEFSYKRTAAANGYEVDGVAIDAYLDVIEKEKEAAYAKLGTATPDLLSGAN